MVRESHDDNVILHAAKIDAIALTNVPRACGLIFHRAKYNHESVDGASERL